MLRYPFTPPICRAFGAADELEDSRDLTQICMLRSNTVIVSPRCNYSQLNTGDPDTKMRRQHSLIDCETKVTEEKDVTNARTMSRVRCRHRTFDLSF